MKREDRIEEGRRRAEETREERATERVLYEATVKQYMSQLSPDEAASEASPISGDMSITSLGPTVTPVEWDVAVKVSREVAIDAARRGDTITYGEIRMAAYKATGMKIGHSMFSRLCEETNRPEDGCLLSSIIVNADTNEPGPGFPPFARREGFDSSPETLGEMTFDRYGDSGSTRSAHLSDGM